MSTNETSPASVPTSMSPVAFARWYVQQVEELWATLNRGQRPPAEKRVNSLVKLTDTWIRLYRAVSDTQALAELAKKLDALRDEIDQQQRSGPTGVVRGGGE